MAQKHLESDKIFECCRHRRLAEARILNLEFTGCIFSVIAKVSRNIFLSHTSSMLIIKVDLE